jgi:hypothetical protein
MLGPLRRVLRDSHVAAITIAILLFESLDSAFRALVSLLEPGYRTILFLITAVTIRGVPHVFEPYDRVSQWMYVAALPSISSAFVSALSAWILSHWVYGAGPLESLATYRDKLTRKSHA